MKRYSTIVFASIIAIVFIFAVLLIYQTLSTFKNFFIEYQKKELSRVAIFVEMNLKPFLVSDTNNFVQIKNLVKQIDSLTNVRITIIDSTGVVLVESRALEKQLDNHINREEIQMAKTAGKGFAVRYSNTMKSDYIYFAKKIYFSTGKYLFLRTAVGKEILNKFYVKVQDKVVLIFLGLFSAILILSFFLSRTLTKPILEVVEASKQVADGNFDVYLDERGETELAFLKHNFNEMVSEIRKSVQALVQQRNFMNNLINTLDQAVAIINSEFEIVFANKFYETLLLNKTHNLDNIRNETVVKQIKEAFYNFKDSTIEIQIDDRVYLSRVRYLSESKQIINVLYDISMIKKVENIKRDLVANVSHELRTPLTAIKGYIETLEEEIPCEQFKYIDTIKKNTERIIHIVDDLLTLVSLEDVSSKLYVSKVDLCELVRQIIPTFKHRLEEKNLDIEILCDKELPLINADAFRLEQVFVNLIDNAIKYSVRGTIRIEMHIEDEETVKIIVSDEGIGIPKEHRERIFERFYTVDKSRSRKFGGTGLGLSIVKHIILLHDGNIQVESQEGKGTKFIIHLPIN
ncbi:MAG: ATP-binding protein [Candidatus Kapaibacteriota bacterium]